MRKFNESFPEFLLLNAKTLAEGWQMCIQTMLSILNSTNVCPPLAQSEQQNLEYFSAIKLY